MQCDAGTNPHHTLYATGCKHISLINAWTIKEPHLPHKTGLDVTQSHAHACTICGPLHVQVVHAQPQIGSLNLCYQKYLWCLHQQQDGETALTFASKKEYLRSVELLLKASADPNHMTMVSTAGKQSLLRLINVFFNFKQRFCCSNLTYRYVRTVDVKK